MMKIKTITCHDVYNVGASLQAYALVTYLRGLGHDAEIIDYKPYYLSHHFQLWGVNNPVYDKPILRMLYNLAKIPSRIITRYSRRKREYDIFKREYLPVTAIRYSSNAELKSNPPEADVYLAGSDQIWNTMFQNGKDPAFYLDFAPKTSIRAAYAASFATEDITIDCKEQVSKWLSQLNYVSVRESSGVELARKLGASNAVCVLDPVFLLSQEQWTSIEYPVQNTEPYVLLYDFDKNTEMLSIARKIADKNGWKVYSVLPNKDSDRCFDQEGPRTFVWLIHHSQFVVSNSFHATAFSLIFHKQFVVFNRKEAINTRMRDLLAVVDLPERLICSVQELGSERINYEKVKDALFREIDFAKNFLDQVISNVK